MLKALFSSHESRDKTRQLAEEFGKPDIDTAACLQLIAEGADVNLRYDEKHVQRHHFKGEGWTPLMRAAHDGNAELMQALLDNGAKIHAKSKTSCALSKSPSNALIEAAINGQADAAKILLEAGAKPETLERAGKTALQHAAEEGHTEVVEVLLDNGAKIDAKTITGETALLLAVQNFGFNFNANINTVKLLLSRGANPNIRSTAGLSPLSFVAGVARLSLGPKTQEMFILLAEHGADTTAYERYCTSTTSPAISSGEAQLEKLMKTYKDGKIRAQFQEADRQGTRRKRTIRRAKGLTPPSTTQGAR
ncbi:MAG: ankyrin repeat domain-containing protein [Alphaproteobacteria bacterium]|nr:ankyrin repeat domain-containing protein [Alphaproteobacteria bacterium]